MKNKKRSLLVVLVAVSAAFIWKCSQQPKENAQIGRLDKSSTKREKKVRSIRLFGFQEKVRDFYQNADADITFFGCVIDQNGHGVGGATVHYQLERAGLLMAEGKIVNNNQKANALSSADGSFSVKGQKGLVITVLKIEKEGYRYVGRNASSFGYRGTPDPHKAESAAPINFLMVSGDTPKTKKLYHDFPKFSWNQGPVEIEIPTVGVITLLPTREKEADQIRGFDWHLTVSMDKAEMVPIDMGEAPIAPNQGYQNKFEYGTNREDKQWSGAVRERYAFKTENGFFGVVDLDIVPDRSDGMQQGSLEVRINESGSRNLDR